MKSLSPLAAPRGARTAQMLCALAVTLAALLAPICNWIGGYLLFYEKNAAGVYGVRENATSYDTAWGCTHAQWKMWAGRALAAHAVVLLACIVLLGVLALLQGQTVMHFLKGVLWLYLMPLCAAYLFTAFFDPMYVTNAMEDLTAIPAKGIRWGVVLLFCGALFLRNRFLKKKPKIQ